MLKILTMVIGIAVTAMLAWSMHRGQDWSGGGGRVPREFIHSYLEMAYTEGRGAVAAREYFRPEAVDHLANAIDRIDGEPIPHDILRVVSDGIAVVVHHRIAAARGEPAQEAVDIYMTRNGKITERRRVSQILVQTGEVTTPPPVAPAVGT